MKSGKLMDLLWKLPAGPGLPMDALAKLVILRLATHANDGLANLWPSVATIAVFTGLSERTVHRKLRLLTKLGLLRVVHRGGNGNEWFDDKGHLQDTTCYAIVEEKLRAMVEEGGLSRTKKKDVQRSSGADSSIGSETSANKGDSVARRDDGVAPRRVSTSPEEGVTATAAEGDSVPPELNNRAERGTGKLKNFEWHYGNSPLPPVPGGEEEAVPTRSAHLPRTEIAEPVTNIGSSTHPVASLDPLEEALARAGQHELESMTTREASKLRRLAEELRGVHATPEEVMVRAARWSFSAPLTSRALVHNWSRLAKPAVNAQKDPERWTREVHAAREAAGMPKTEESGTSKANRPEGYSDDRYLFSKPPGDL
ncbi:MAG: Helix-turn-helix domain [Actinomycetota bacterium]|jgi:hypothetical protein|nr:Helix-turn-helix domain [Actinomycetota bacterium]